MTFHQRFKLVYQALKSSFVHLAYPKKCLHCSLLLSPDAFVLCSTCVSLLDYIEPSERCPSCFNIRIQESCEGCPECVQYPNPYTRMGSVFDYDGPAASLIRHLKYFNQPYLAAGMGAFLVAQWDRLQWPLPEVIVPVPISFSRWIGRGYNQSTLLAEEVGKLLQRPVWQVLKRKSGDFSQAALTLEQRKSLSGQRFKLDSKFSIKKKIVLVIDDVMTSGSTLRRCGEILNLGEPKMLYALTFCRTLL